MVEKYRGYTIEYDPPPIGIRTCDYRFVHEDYDGTPDEDGGVGDRRCGAASSVEAAKREIDMLEDED